MGMTDAQVQRAALIVLAHCVEPADRELGRSVARLGPAVALQEIESGRAGGRHREGLLARRAGVDADEAVARAASVDARIVTRVDAEWPTQLNALGDAAPMALWVRGSADLRLLALRSLAMVGARACSMYGEEVARTWACELAERRWTVVSGAAFGIDAAAHRGALLGGTTIAVLAGGVDVPYPRAHEALLHRIADDGLVVSETPPGESVRRQRFLSRNRVIAALTRATVVVEAAERSGTAATAHAALSLDRIVLAVPGPVTSPVSRGCHRLIAEEGALLAADVGDVLAAVDLGASAAPASVRGERDGLSAREQRVLDSLHRRVWLDAGQVVRACGLAPGEVLASLGVLVAAGWACESESGWRVVP